MFDNLGEKFKKYILEIKEDLENNSGYISFIIFLVSFASLAFIPQSGLPFLLASTMVLVSSGCFMYKLFDDYYHENDFHISDRIKKFLGLDTERKILDLKGNVVLLTLVIFIFLSLFSLAPVVIFEALAMLGLMFSAGVLICESYESYSQLKKKSREEYEENFEYDDSLICDPDYYFIGEKMERSVDSLDAKWNEENEYMDKCLTLSEKIENAAYEGYEDDLDKLYGLMQGYTFEDDLSKVYEEALLGLERNVQSKGYSRQRKLK